MRSRAFRVRRSGFCGLSDRRSVAPPESPLSAAERAVTSVARFAAPPLRLARVNGEQRAALRAWKDPRFRKPWRNRRALDGALRRRRRCAGRPASSPRRLPSELSSSIRPTTTCARDGPSPRRFCGAASPRFSFHDARHAPADERKNAARRPIGRRRRLGRPDGREKEIEEARARRVGETARASHQTARDADGAARRRRRNLPVGDLCWKNFPPAATARIAS